MPTPSLATCTFQTRQDDFSAQVSCDQDPKFWFRLEESQGEDTITDFFIGGFDPSLGGDLLTMCYRKIGRTPAAHLVFRDVLASRPADPAAADAEQLRLEGYTKEMLAGQGRAIQTSHIVHRRGKLDLMIDTKTAA
jgi:hypothetical protein